MAIQDGIFPLKGSIGNVTFVRTKGGVYRAQPKTSVNKERILSDRAFERTRENNAEFGRACKAAALLRLACTFQLKNQKTAGLTPRLMSEMMKVVKLDLVNVRGMRKVLDAET